MVTACGIFPALDDFPPLPRFEPYTRRGISFARQRAYNDSLEAVEMEHDWKIKIHRSDAGKVTMQVQEDESMGGAITYIGRVPLWDDLPSSLLGGCIVEFAKGLTVDFDGKQTGERIHDR